MRWDPAEYLETAVHEVLTSATPDRAIGHAVLLLAALGERGCATRLVDGWHAATERTVADLVQDRITGRALAMLVETWPATPAWAVHFAEFDLTVEDDRQHRSLATGPNDTAAVFGDSTAGTLLGKLAEHVTGPTRPATARRAVRAAAGAAHAGNTAVALDELSVWAGLSGHQPNVALPTGCRALARLLCSGALAVLLAVPRDWPASCAGELLAAYTARQRRSELPRTAIGYRELIDDIVAARTTRELPAAAAPPPATPEAIEYTQRRLGLRFPKHYRDFLLVANGLPADIAFPELRGLAELTAPGEPRRQLVLSRPTPQLPGAEFRLAADGTVVEDDPLLGTRTYPTVHALLSAHLAILHQLG